MNNIYDNFFEITKGKKIRRKDWDNQTFVIPVEVDFNIGGGMVISCKDQDGEFCNLILTRESDAWDWDFFEENSIKTCSCGARHTIRPDYHLDFCDLYKKDN
jgi:hypothetical protein